MSKDKNRKLYKTVIELWDGGEEQNFNRDKSLDKILSSIGDSGFEYTVSKTTKEKVEDAPERIQAFVKKYWKWKLKYFPPHVG